jgi:hypothetical protein
MPITSTPTKSSLNNAASPSLASFHIFPSLVVELREKIWKLACLDERIVHVGLNQQFIPESKASTPAVLHTCRESRVFGLEIYKPLVVFNRSLPTFVNFTQDLVFIEHPALFNSFAEQKDQTCDIEVSKNCQRLAVPFKRWLQFLFIHDPQKAFPKKKELIIIPEDAAAMRGKKLRRLVEPSLLVKKRKYADSVGENIDVDFKKSKNATSVAENDDVHFKQGIFE